MAIVPQVYTLTPQWTLDQLVALMRQIFIDAGLMTDWYDSVDTNTNYKHRILRLTNDASKTYGYQFLWFTFYWDGGTVWDGYVGNCYIYLQFANGWNPSTHIPTGTQYLDYYNTSCANNANGSTSIWGGGNRNQAYAFVRYTSGIDSNYTYIGGQIGLLIKKSIGTPPSWLDLNKQSAFSTFILGSSSSASANGYRVLYFYIPHNIRRMLFAGRSFNGNFATGPVVAAYSYGGTSTLGDVNDAGANGNWNGACRLPVFQTSVNPAYASNYAPIITGIDACSLLDCRLPDDFAITTTLGVTPAFRDLIYITPGSEAWEVAASTSAGATNSMVFLARTT